MSLSHSIPHELVINQLQDGGYASNLSRPISDILVGKHFTIQHPTSKLLDMYGTITAVGPH